jgi:TRAP-type C4-dicarboxylate transport system permease small subunit
VSALDALDAALARWERRAAGGMLALMGVVVFASVVHRMAAAGLARVAPSVRVPGLGMDAAQPFALALTLWVGMLGASLAAHERRHLALDIGSKLWPAAWRPRVAAAGHLVTAAFCVGILWLAGRSVADHLALWRDTDGAAGTLSGTSIPRWLAVAAIPWGMATLALRFSAEAWRAWTGRRVEDGDDTLHQLGIATGEDA